MATSDPSGGRRRRLTEVAPAQEDVGVALRVSRAVAGRATAAELLGEVAAVLLADLSLRALTGLVPSDDGMGWEAAVSAGAEEDRPGPPPPAPAALGPEDVLPGPSGAILLPLRGAADAVTGLLVLAPPAGGWVGGAPGRQLLVTVGSVVGQALESLAARQALTAQVRLDTLTGLGNRAGLEERLALEHFRASRYGPGLALLICDLDGFKRVNDRFGHLVGDEALRAVGGLMRATLRASDYAARLGGDEFAVVLPHTDADAAIALAERLRHGVQDLPEARRYGLTASIGVAAHVGDETAEGLTHRADAAMYAAKVGGRNRAQMAPSDERELVVFESSELDEVDLLLVRSLIVAVDAKDAAIGHASRGVGTVARAVAAELGLPERIQRYLQVVGVLHDVGNIGIATPVLARAGALSEGERLLVRAHVHIGERILRGMGLVAGSVWVRHHHEHVDGSGYPDGLAGDEIPLPARALQVADAFGAMVTPRPFRASRTVDEALAEILDGAGRQFDAGCAEALAAALRREPDLWARRPPPLGL